MKAIVADPVGGPENLKLIEVPRPEPSPSEVLIKIEVSGVNYIDVYFREGFYNAPEKPVRIGSEAAGVVEWAPAGSAFTAGQRVSYAMARGSYAEYAAVPEKFLVNVPDSVNAGDAAASMVQGMTAHYLTHSTFKLERGQTCLIHAAAGGAGLMLVQVAKILGATVIATVSTEAKAQLAAEHGADHTILYTQTDFVEAVKNLTGGKGVHVVYDSVGKDTFAKSLDCLRARGLMATFGQSSGPIGSVDPLVLSQKGSLFLTRPSLANYISEPGELQWRSRDLFGWIAEGRVRTLIYKRYPLADAASAHRDLQARKTSGKLLLEP